MFSPHVREYKVDGYYLVVPLGGLSSLGFSSSICLTNASTSLSSRNRSGSPLFITAISIVLLPASTTYREIRMKNILGQLFGKESKVIVQGMVDGQIGRKQEREIDSG